MRKRLLRTALIPPALVLIGTGGYHFVEGWSLFDALYMSVITLTTVGFAETHPLSTAGRVFTIVLSLGGIFTLFFTGTELVRTWASGELRQLLGRQRGERVMNTLKDHVIVCGYGRMGRLVCTELSKVELPYVIIDNREERLADFALPCGLALRGDATADESLKQAGIGRARAVVTVLPSDADNLFITMSARLLNERVAIIARAEEEATVGKLVRAGATRVVSPFVIGGAQVAHAILKPAVLDFIDVATRGEHLELQLEELVLEPESALAGRSILESKLREKRNIIVVAIKRPGEPMAFNPSDDTVLEAGATLVMLGARDQLDELERIAKRR